jgi:hypothetical protein
MYLPAVRADKYNKLFASADMVAASCLRFTRFLSPIGLPPRTVSQIPAQACAGCVLISTKAVRQFSIFEPIQSIASFVT